ncbi:uncharacterized protein LOC131227097 [Magnolia sinica]|uniref:uncharacterized protein LOC131227097 n=1 Tax=Magnolia sinica TaxID=86752 RepID=UPI002657DC25|nr:uncharacterized protein LOC131227097 [Magnolia sinica]
MLWVTSADFWASPSATVLRITLLFFSVWRIGVVCWTLTDPLRKEPQGVEEEKLRSPILSAQKSFQLSQMIQSSRESEEVKLSHEDNLMERSGLGSKQKRRLIKSSCSRNNPHIICLQETKMKGMDSQLMSSIWKASDASWVIKEASGSLGGILIAWRVSHWPLLNSSVGSFSISATLRNSVSSKDYLICSVYGPTNFSLRSAFWKELSSICQSFNGPICFAGDFNSIRFLTEKSSGNSSKSQMAAFLDWIDSNSLFDLPLLGSRFTWTNGRLDPILCRLDRFIISAEWLNLVPTSSQSILPKTTSDHWPLILSTEEVDWGPKPFRFNIAWLHMTGFKSMIADWWHEAQFQGYAGHRLCCKLKFLKDKLKQWSKEEKIHSIQELDSILRDIQKIDTQAESSPMSSHTLANRIQLVQALSDKIYQEEISWKQKARMKWTKEGDRNTSYFHNIASVQDQVNRITCISSDGVWTDDSDTISTSAVSFFQCLLQKENWSRPRLDNL